MNTRDSILLVEDDPDDAELTVRALRKHRLANDVVVARDGVDALEYVFATGKWEGRDIAERPQVILLDLNLPRVDGLEVLRRIRADERTRLLPVVILISSREDMDRLKSYNLGANSYMQKPVDFRKFMEATQQLSLYWMVLNEPPPPVPSESDGMDVHPSDRDDG